MTTSNSSSTDEVGTTSAASTSEQTATNDTVAKIDYTRLQSESTKWRQNEIDMAIRLVSKDKSELNTITDAKLRDAVVKATSSYSSYDEMVAIE